MLWTAVRLMEHLSTGFGYDLRHREAWSFLNEYDGVLSFDLVALVPHHSF